MTKENRELLKVKLITTFDDLPSELILFIFKYLSVTERYGSFFDYDTRFRRFVKQWTSYSRKALDSDIRRFSTLHSWYKHLSFENGGSEYFIIPKVGQQARYSFDPCISDTTGLHWWFLINKDLTWIMDERVLEIVRRNSFRLNPFFYCQKFGTLHVSGINGKEPEGESVHVHPGGEIMARKSFEPWVRNNYSELADGILHISEMDMNIAVALQLLSKAEALKTQQAIQKAAHQIWEELKSVEDFNPLKILDIL